MYSLCMQYSYLKATEEDYFKYGFSFLLFILIPLPARLSVPNPPLFSSVDQEAIGGVLFKCIICIKWPFSLVQ